MHMPTFLLGLIAGVCLTLALIVVAFAVFSRSKPAPVTPDPELPEARSKAAFGASQSRNHD